MQAWTLLSRQLDPQRPANDQQYRRPGSLRSALLVGPMRADPAYVVRALLVGGTGCGKSSELRALSRELAEHRQVIGLDIDAMGISALTVSALDLCYLAGVAMLRRLPPARPEVAQLFARLKQTYTQRDSDQLGSLEEAIAGVVDFAGAAGAMAAEVGLLPGAAPAVAAAATLVQKLIRLSPQGGAAVSEGSPQGRAMLEALAQASRLLREQDERRRPVCLCIDGLEKMNGEARRRLGELFSQTRLLADLPFSCICAAPSCVMTGLSHTAPQGWENLPIWGFLDQDEPLLSEALSQRFAQGLEAGWEAKVEEGVTARIARSSGGLPRHAMKIARWAAEAAAAQAAPRLELAHVEEAERRLGEELALGLNTRHLQVMKKVHQGGSLRGEEEEDGLFALGIIQAMPPGPAQRRPRYRVHPLLLGELEGGEA